MNRPIVIAALLLVSAVPALAVTTPISGSYSIQYAPSKGNAPTFTDVLAGNFTENLTVGTPTAATKFFAVTPAGSCGYDCVKKTATGTITVNFDFANATVANISSTAAYMANYGNDTDSVTWNTKNPLVVNFTDGSILDINLIDASDWTIYPKICFDLIQGATTHVPEPGTLAIFGAALLSLGYVVVRRRKKARAVAV